MERADGVFRDVGFERAELLPREQFQIFDAVMNASFVKRFEGLHVLIVETDDEGTVVAVFHAEFLTDFRHQFRAFDVEFCFERSFFCGYKPV